MIVFLPAVAKIDQPNAAYAGLPELVTTNTYKITSENVSVTMGVGATVTVSSLTVYRNVGAAGTGEIKLLDGGFDPSKPIKAMWDNKPIAFHMTSKMGEPIVVSAMVTLGKDATHSLKIAYGGKLARSGYSKDEYSFRYVMIGSHPIDLFAFAYRYPDLHVFGLPTLMPDLGWEVGMKGAAIRKTDFTPDGAQSSIEFYLNSMANLGHKN